MMYIEYTPRNGQTVSSSITTMVHVTLLVQQFLSSKNITSTLKKTTTVYFSVCAHTRPPAWGWAIVFLRLVPPTLMLQLRRALQSSKSPGDKLAGLPSVWSLWPSPRDGLRDWRPLPEALFLRSPFPSTGQAGSVRAFVTVRCSSKSCMNFSAVILWPQLLISGVDQSSGNLNG